MPKNGKTKHLKTACCMALFTGILLVIVGCQSDPWEAFQSLGPEGIPKSARTNQQPQSVILREGDMLNIVFPSSTSLNTSQQIRRDGKIVMPLIGEVVAAGKTPDELQNDLINLYQPQVDTKQILVTVQSSTFSIYVTGAVLRPGEIQANHPMTALEAVMQAGGFDTTKANAKAVVIVRQVKSGTKKFTVNLQKMMEGSNEKPFYLEPSDIIFVPEKFQWF